MTQHNYIITSSYNFVWAACESEVVMSVNYGAERVGECGIRVARCHGTRDGQVIVVSRVILDISME